jgi:hypothetical protein
MDCATRETRAATQGRFGKVKRVGMVESRQVVFGMPRANTNHETHEIRVKVTLNVTTLAADHPSRFVRMVFVCFVHFVVGSC